MTPIQKLCCLLLLGSFMTACSDDMARFSDLERLRILGVRIDSPEFCPFSEQLCPPGTYRDQIEIAILAADKEGIVADGLHPDGPYVRPGYDLTWALCSHGLWGLPSDEPDCTQRLQDILNHNTARITIPTSEILAAVQRTLEESGQFPSGSGDLPTDEEGLFSFEQLLGMAVERNEQEREWGIKRLTLSNQVADKININPIMNSLTLGGVEVQPGDEPFAEVKTGYAYKIDWDIPDELWQRYTFEDIDGPREVKEAYNLWCACNEGSFSKGDEVDLWMQSDTVNELFWRPPLEVPEEGMEVTLIFNLLDYRGGSTWRWGKVRVVRGEGSMPG